MTKAGLPVGMAIDAPERSDHQLLAIGLAVEGHGVLSLVLYPN
jgi:Asp-tRNA(Asn)/Glu-tRNA(Gln) amidotransferase A subunit family amidase